MKTTLAFFTFLFLLPFYFQGQTIHWQEESKRTYIFEISNDEAEKFVKYQSKDSLAILEMLHTPRGSFVKKWDDVPQQGHFIFVKIEKGRVYYDYVPIIPFQIFMFQEYGAMTLQIVDSQDKIRNDAKVYVRGKRKRQDISVPYSKSSKTYSIYEDLQYRNRLMTVELDTFRAIFDLSKKSVNPYYGRSAYYNSRPSFYAYMITDKNKYKPGETVRFKSYSLYGNHTPVNTELEIWLQVGRYGKSKRIDVVTPYNPGGYAGEFVLHDSLQLKLDNHYTIQLRDNKGKIVASTNFKYEDYELFDSRLETKLDKLHYAPNANSLEIKALDANNLLLQDVQAEIIVKRGTIQDVFSDLLQLPDTLLYEKIELDNGKPTLVDIPADLFGESNCTYNVTVKVLTHDNQALSSFESAIFYKSIYNLFTYTQNDTICFQFHELGQNKNMQAKFWINDDTINEKIVNLPLKIPFDQFVKKYHFKIDSLNFSQTISVASIHARLDIKGGIHQDTFNVKLINPLNLELSWYLYQGNRLLEKGFGKEFDFKYPEIDLNKVHYVELFYLIGGTKQYFNQAFVPKIDFLDIAIDLPDRIDPGQSIDAIVSVKDYWGNPLQDVDLTAFAYNSQLDYNVPDLSYYGVSPQTREKRASYSFRDKNHSLSVPFNYGYWCKKLQLDTIKYYQPEFWIRQASNFRITYLQLIQ